MTDQRFFVVRSPRDVVHISGPEVVDYLQGQISQEVEALETGESRLSFALEPRGRVESLFRLTRLAADIFLADTEPGFGKGLRQSLERFKLGTKAEFETAAWQMLAVRGDCDRALADGLAVDTLWPGSARAAPDAPSAQLTAGFDVLAEAPALSLPAPPADAGRAAEILEWLRLLHGLPLIGREIQPGDIPNETGIVEAAASFTKGCYRGQELVERIDSRAGGRRLLRRLRSTAPLAVGDTLLDAAGTEVGTVLSAALRPAPAPGLPDPALLDGAPPDAAAAGFATLRADADVDEVSTAASAPGQIVVLAL